MRTREQMICDRCGAPKHYIEVKGNNGMVAYSYDLCHWCFEELKAMMLYRRNFDRTAPHEH